MSVYMPFFLIKVFVPNTKCQKTAVTKISWCLQSKICITDMKLSTSSSVRFTPCRSQSVLTCISCCWMPRAWPWDKALDCKPAPSYVSFIMFFFQIKLKRLKIKFIVLKCSWWTDFFHWRVFRQGEPRKYFFYNFF